MNQRIQALQKIAHQEALKRSKVAPDMCTEYSDYFAAMKQEIFAELIVQDCISVAEDLALKHQVKEDTYSAGKKAGAFEVANAVKEHFGVK